ncbi:MAG: TIR domain-containing protein [Turicibacter sp.]|nr:TIR domain-containing protein [Turicibacter sp.]
MVRRFVGSEGIMSVQMEKDTRDFFISYNKADKKWAKWVAGTLENFGYTTNIQAWDIRPGDDFISKMNEFLEYSKAFIPILSEEYMKSPYCEKELSVALNKHLKTPEYRFFPIRVAEVDPSELIQTIVYVDIFDKDEDEAKKVLKYAVDKNPIPRTRPPFPGNKKQAERPPFPGGATTKKLPHISNLPPRNKHFTGREEMLENISRRFQHEPMLSIVGNGGYGKTQLAVEYAYRNATKYDYIWIANAESKLTLEQSYRKFALRIDLPSAETVDFGLVLRYVESWLEGNQRYLFIFDNAEGLSAELREFLPKGQILGHILINIRKKWAGLTDESMDLGLFLEGESLAFLRKRNENINANDAETLSELLGYLPLALEHAAAYMAETRLTCAQYIKLFKSEGAKLLGTNVSTIASEKTIAVTWLVSIKKMKLEGAVQLFNLCAYFAPDDIPLSMFIEGCTLPEPLCDDILPGLSQNEILRDLERFSLMSFRRDGNGNVFLSMHRIIQLVVRDSHGKDTQWLAYCLDLAYNTFDYKLWDRQLMDTFEQNVDHILEIANRA